MHNCTSNGFYDGNPAKFDQWSRRKFLLDVRIVCKVYYVFTLHSFVLASVFIFLRGGFWSKFDSCDRFIGFDLVSLHSVFVFGLELEVILVDSALYLPLKALQNFSRVSILLRCLKYRHAVYGSSMMIMFIHIIS